MGKTTTKASTISNSQTYKKGTGDTKTSSTTMVEANPKTKNDSQTNPKPMED
jgi:hypothetical protein